MPSLSLLPAALRELGLPTLFRYGTYQLSLRSGTIRRRTPARRWSARPLQEWVPLQGIAEAALHDRQSGFLATDPGSPAKLAEALHGCRADLLAEAEAVLRGEFRLFGAPPQRLGFPPPWNLPPGLGQPSASSPLSPDRHWTDYDLEADLDLRSLWELSRLGWVFPLARAYWLTGQAQYWEGCWTLLESWRAANPPNTGPQWISAQEAGLRILVLSFAWQVFEPELRRQPERAAALLELVAACAGRVPPTLGYALAQRNNHLLSEAVGMYTAGSLFPALPDARRWRRLGRRWLVRALADQVFPDGGYIQHSVNYHRQALSLGLWAGCVAQSQADPLPQPARSALERLARSLAALVDPNTGLAPHLGHDDGSQVLPLSACEHADQRPVLQAAWRALCGGPLFAPGPWDELSLWLGLLPQGSGEAPTPVTYPSDFPDAGIYLLRGRHARAALRCARFRSRPAHSDQLQLDLWHRGRNIALDPGSYLYAAPAPWDNALARAAAHNGPMAKGFEPMRRAGRFLWLDWAQGRLIGRWRSPTGELEVLAAEHFGYRRKGLQCRRTVVHAGEDLWLVVDELQGAVAPQLRIHWTLPDLPWKLVDPALRLGRGPTAFHLTFRPSTVALGLYRAGELLEGLPLAASDEAATLGWNSPWYGSLDPTLSLLARLSGSSPLRLESWWAFGKAQAEELQVEWSAPEATRSPITRLAWKGEQLLL
jgi:hypothetical protein